MASASPPLDQGLKELNDAESPDEDGSDSQMQDAGSKAREEDESRAPPPPPPGAAASAVLSTPKVHLECPAQQLHVLGEYARALARVVACDAANKRAPDGRGECGRACSVHARS